MEFRMTPMILAIMHTMFIAACHPALNTLVPVRDLADFSRTLLPYGLMVILAITTYLRHTYYSKAFRITFMLLHVLSLALLLAYLLAIRSEHL